MNEKMELFQDHVGVNGRTLFYSPKPNVKIEYKQITNCGMECNWWMVATSSFGN